MGRCLDVSESMLKHFAIRFRAAIFSAGLIRAFLQEREAERKRSTTAPMLEELCYDEKGAN